MGIAYRSQGQILEKMKDYDSACDIYKQGAQIIENALGPNHPLIPELMSMVKGARLRSAYYVKNPIEVDDLTSMN